MLAAKCPPSWTREQYLEFISNNGPYYTQPKIDGIRFLKVNGLAHSRKFLEIPNTHITDFIANSKLQNGCDGEIITLDTNSQPDDFNTIQSKVMTRAGKPEFRLVIFDYAPDGTLNESFDKRYMKQFWYDHNPDAKFDKEFPSIQTLHPSIRFYDKKGDIDWIEQVESYYTKELNFEGVIFRKLTSRYKCARSTLKEGYLIALTHWLTSEAIVIGFEEMQHNDNHLSSDEFGNAKRSKSIVGLKGADTLGALVVRDIKTLKEFKIGSGFTAKQKQEIWNTQEQFVGSNRLLTYKHKPYNQKDLPRHPIFVGWRLDL